MTDQIDETQLVVEATSFSETKPEIIYDDFAKLDIRLGTITLVEVVPDADKLLRLEVDFGSFQRQILSGIREYITEPETLVGRQCPFVVNLAPRTIRGLESQGMILAAGEGDIFALLHPREVVPAGTSVA